MGCWVPRELAADSVLTPYGQLRPLQARDGVGLAELVELVDPVTGSKARSWRRAVVRVPCGRCPGCEVDWRREWTTRLMAEYVDGPRGYPEEPSCWFATFTFAPESVPVREVAGERVMSLDPDVWEAFERKLRDALRYWWPEARLRRAVVGEYGSKRLRPHHHALLFDCPLPDARADFEASAGRRYPLMVSPWLTRLWGHGAVLLGRVDRASVSYTLAYMAKAARWPFGVVEPFRLISSGHGKRSVGGMGAAYFEKRWREIYPEGKIMVGSPGDVRAMPSPRYFNRRLREREFEVWLSFERARLERAREWREKSCVSSRQAKVLLVWQKLTGASRDGTVASEESPTGSALPVAYRNGDEVDVPVVSRFDEHVVLGSYGREAGFGLSDYLDEIAMRCEREAREVPLDVGQTGDLVDTEGNRVEVRGIVGSLRRDSRGFIGSRVDVGEIVEPVSSDVVVPSDGLFPASIVRDAGFPELRRAL